MKRLMVVLLLLSAAFGLWWLLSPSHNYAALADVRDREANDTSADIVVAAVGDAQHGDYLQGIALAVAEINARPGRLLGRALRLRIEQSQDDADAEIDQVRRLANDARVVAVLGHRPTGVALAASLVYEEARVIFLPPFVTQKSLTGPRFRYVVRLAPSGSVMTDQLASLAGQLGYRKIVVVNARDDYSSELALLFGESAALRDIQLVGHISFKPNDEDYRPLVSQLKDQTFDAVFLSSAAGPGARMVRQMRELGVNVPVLGTTALNGPDFKAAVGQAGDNTVVPVLYRASQGGARNEAFVARFSAARGRLPDESAAQGYDSVWLLVQAIERAKSTRPAAVMSALHAMPYWMGVTDLQAFDEKGDPRGKNYQLQRLVAGQWQALPLLPLRYQLERAQSDSAMLGTPMSALGQSAKSDMGLEDIAAMQLGIAHDVLRFQRLGVLVAGDGDQADLQQRLQWIERAGAALGFKVRGCRVSLASGPDDCLRELQGSVQVLMLAHADALSPAQADALTQRLGAVPAPLFALSAAGAKRAPIGLSLFIDQAVNQEDFALATQQTAPLVARDSVTQVLASLGNLPVLKADLARLLALGQLGNPVLINLFTQELEPTNARVGTKPTGQAAAAARAMEVPAASASLTPVRP